MRQTATYIKRGTSKSISPSCSELNLPSTWDVTTKYTANSFSRRYFQMCFAGPSMGKSISADADQMSPDEALHLGLHY